MIEDSKAALERMSDSSFMSGEGAYVLVDGQYGSTGKGLFASFLAEAKNKQHCYRPIANTTNAGPNSGHTFYIDRRKHVLRQLPTFATYMAIRNPSQVSRCTLNAGAIIDPEVFWDEATRYPNLTIKLHSNAAIITKEMKELEKHITGSIGSTGKGVGAALAAKINRTAKVAGNYAWPKNVELYDSTEADFRVGTTLVEVAQGFSLGINRRFYPWCTSRECTVGQAMSDADIHPMFFKGCIATYRTYPIRVGGNSGAYYPDQRELTWDELGVEPETTTVTGKTRRVFTWSAIQYKESLIANRPSVLFLNFCNYIEDVEHFVRNKVVDPYVELFGIKPTVYLGFGPEVKDIMLWGYN